MGGQELTQQGEKKLEEVMACANTPRQCKRGQVERGAEEFKPMQEANSVCLMNTYLLTDNKPTVVQVHGSWLGTCGQ